MEKWVLIDLDINKVVAWNGRKHNLLQQRLVGGMTKEERTALQEGDEFTVKRTKKIPGWVNGTYKSDLFQEEEVHHYRLDRMDVGR